MFRRRSVVCAVTQQAVERLESRMLLSTATVAAACAEDFASTAATVALSASDNVALSCPTYASSQESKDLAAGYATDGNSTTRWSSGYSDPQWIYVDLGQRYDISAVVLSWERAYGADYQIQVSDDAVQWTSIKSVTGGAGGVEELTGLSGSGRYVRMYGTRRGTPWGYSLWAFEVYGTLSAVQPVYPVVNLLATTLSTTSAYDGQVITLGYQISSDSTASVVLDGTLTGPTGLIADDNAGEATVTLTPGTGWYYRSFLVNLPPGAAGGAYDVAWTVQKPWGGVASSVRSAYLNVASPVSVRVPILMYHKVDDIAYSNLYVTTSEFRMQMQTLHDYGYTPITLGDLSDIRAGLMVTPTKPVIITFDDAYENLLTKAYPILSEFGFVATCFVPTERVGGTNAWDVGAIQMGEPVINHLTWTEIQELDATGLIDFESHTMTHPYLASVDDAQLAAELVGSKQALESHLPGHTVQFLCYPYGSGAGDPRVEAAVYAAGYSAAVTVVGGVEADCLDKFDLHRVYIGPGNTVPGFVSAIGDTLKAPSAPSNLIVTATSATQVSLNWTDTAVYETGLLITYATDASLSQNLVTISVAAGSTGASITGLRSNTTYYFRVCATNGAGRSGFSNTASAATLALGVADLALNRPTYASSQESKDLPASYATDGNSTTRWASGYSDPQWIYVDLGQRYDISAVVLSWERAYGADYQIQVSDDAVQWTSIKSVTGGVGGVEELTGLSGSGRYVRMYGTRRGTPWGYSLWAFEVYGTLSAVQPMYASSHIHPSTRSSAVHTLLKATPGTAIDLLA